MASNAVESLAEQVPADDFQALEQKIYRHHSGYPGGLKEVPAKRLRPTRADWMLREAVLGMLPKNKLRALRAKKLRIYLDDKGLARHAGQKPQAAAL